MFLIFTPVSRSIDASVICQPRVKRTNSFICTTTALTGSSWWSRWIHPYLGRDGAHSRTREAAAAATTAEVRPRDTTREVCLRIHTSIIALQESPFLKGSQVTRVN